MLSAPSLSRDAEAAPREGTLCAHCGLAVPAGLLREGDVPQYCCHGCETAYQIIQGCGLERYYRLRDAVDEAPRTPVRQSRNRYAEFDDPVFHDLYVRALPGGVCRVELFLEGVHCAACVWLVEKLPQIVPGILESRLDARRSLVAIVWDPTRTQLSDAAKTLESLGYPPHPARDGAARDVRRADERRALIRLAIAGACAGNVMLLALALYAGLFDTMEPHYRALFRWTSMGISLVSVAWPGSVFFRGALAAIRTRTMHLDLPIAIGLGAGAVWGAINTVRGAGEIYFDSLSVLVFALLVGRLIHRRQQRWASDAIELLYALTPTAASVVECDALGNEVVRDVPIEAVQVGAAVEVRAGDSIPVDGEVLVGSSAIDESLLTGESRPVEVGVGDAVVAGAVNLSGRLRVRVTATGEQTRVGKLMRMVEEGTRRRAPIVRLADRIAGWFVAAMVLLAAATALIWMRFDPSRAIDNAVALLIVTCPCALGLATPLAVTVAIGRAARRGILIKGGDALERLGRSGIVYLDKTGTLTVGGLSLMRWIGDESVRTDVAALESHSSHPIARALVRDLAAAEIPTVDAVVQTNGGGIEGRVRGRVIVVGSPSFVRARASDRSFGSDEQERALVADGLTPIAVGVDGRIAALAGLGDSLRPDAIAAVRRLKELGWRVRILSGDHPEVVRSVALRLGIDPCDALGGVMPETKLEIVTAASKGDDPVVMVGDGVNDAGALAAAGVGIAVHGGAEASLAAADIYLSRPGLSPIVDLIDGSRRTIGVIRRNFAASLFYNSVAAALAVTGIINPLIAAILMPASSLTVLTLSFRSRTFDRPEAKPCR